MNILNTTNYKPKAFSKMLNITTITLQRWDSENIAKSIQNRNRPSQRTKTRTLKKEIFPKVYLSIF